MNLGFEGDDWSAASVDQEVHALRPEPFPEPSQEVGLQGRQSGIEGGSDVGVNVAASALVIGSRAVQEDDRRRSFGQNRFPNGFLLPLRLSHLSHSQRLTGNLHHRRNDGKSLKC